MADIISLDTTGETQTIQAGGVIINNNFLSLEVDTDANTVMLETDSEAIDIGHLTQAVKDYLFHTSSSRATSDPDVDDDNTNGCLAGAIWLNTTNEKLWVSIDDTTAAAVWKEILKLDVNGEINPGIVNQDSTNRFVTDAQISTWDSKEPEITTKNSAFNKNFGNSATEVCVGNDSRLNNLLHFNVGNEYNGVANKYPAINTDRILIEDNDDSYNKKYVFLTDLPVSSATQTAINGKSDNSHSHTLTSLSEKSYTNLDDKPTIVTPSGLEKVGLGLVKIDRNESNYGTVGINAVDLSHSGTSSNSRGATGVYSFATGSNVTASGAYSVAMGDNCQATKSGSVALGQSNSATGAHSKAVGYQSTAQAHTSFVIGTYNIVQGSETAWVEADDLFVAGNGADSVSRSNALCLKKNGNLEIAGKLKINNIDVTEESTSVTADTDDLNQYKQFNNASDITYTLNTGIGSKGDTIEGVQMGAGQVTITGSATINSFENSNKTAGQYATFKLKCIDTDIWILEGVLV